MEGLKHAAKRKTTEISNGSNAAGRSFRRRCPSLFQPLNSHTLLELTFLNARRDGPVSMVELSNGGGQHDGTSMLKPATRGAPLQLPLDLIDEDPHQPRAADSPGFSAASLGELAKSVRLRGVKTPISVREHPGRPGRYIVNHGARRFRAARLAGLRTVPAFIDNDYNETDQVIENLQRNDLTAREIADYIGRELARGLRRKEIAQRISKSAAYVTQHATLLDLPAPVARAFSSARVRDVSLVNELVQAYRDRPDVVTAWLDDDQQEITRGSVRMLREFLAQSTVLETLNDAQELAAGDSVPDASSLARQARAPAFKGVLLFTHAGLSCELLMLRPSSRQLAWVRYEDGRTAEVRLSDLQGDAWRGL